jgi:hypothetical protein
MRNSSESHKSNTEAEVIPIESRRPESGNSLLPKLQVEELRARWDAIQAAFIDEPSAAVKDADALVAAAIQEISEASSDQRRQLEEQWSRGDNISTEDLRIALQRYRTFFSRLLSL